MFSKILFVVTVLVYSSCATGCAAKDNWLTDNPNARKGQKCRKVFSRNTCINNYFHYKGGLMPCKIRFNNKGKLRCRNNKKKFIDCGKPAPVRPPAVQPTCMCSKILARVCDEKTQTAYDNKCLAKCAGVKDFTAGECKKSEASTCEACVATGRSWQGRCNPSSDCLIMDIGCYKSPKQCQVYNEQQAAVEKCKTIKDCSTCTNSAHCGWDVTKGTCFMAANAFFGDYAKCPQPATTIQPPPCMCSKILARVCDEKTQIAYDNKCLAQCAGVEDFTTGECKKSEAPATVPGL